MLKWMSIIITIIHILVISPWILADTETNQETESSGIIFVPGAFYQPETRWGLAAGLLYFFQPDEDSNSQKPSSISTNIIYTQNNQKMITIIPTFYLNNQEFISRSEIRFRDYPEKFYGTGNTSNDDYTEFTAKGYQFSSSLKKKIYKDLYAGLSFDYKNIGISELDGGEPERQKYLSSFDDSAVFGAGLHISYDTRDNIFYSLRGELYNIMIDLYNASLFSDYSFTSYQIDFRFFRPLYGNSIALQLYSHFNTGDCPFYFMPSLGGPSLLRGITRYRYRDNNLIAVQAEYRIRLSEKFAAAVFAGIGSTFSDISEMSFNEVKISGGAGLRYKLSSNGVNFRFDIAFGGEGTKFYLGVLEAI